MAIVRYGYLKNRLNDIGKIKFLGGSGVGVGGFVKL